ncbi:MAG: SH3 domain-containing protein, partial [Firmicutes bacterium]|nr:SH3 domain-containing protein [Bacillota bacterium]
VNGKKGWIISTYSKLVSVSSETTATTAKPTATSKTASTTNKTTATTVTPKYEVLVTGNNVNVRSGAGTNYGIVTSVKKGQKLTYLGEKTANGKKWYNVEVNGKKGWIIGTYSKLVSASSQTTAVKDSYVIITGSAVNVRSGAGTNYSVVTAVYKGQKFKYSDVKTVDKTKWYKITVNGTTGWVAGTYVKVSN